MLVLDAHHSISIVSQQIEARLYMKNELSAGSNWDCEIWWSHRALVIGHVPTIVSSRKLFHRNRNIGEKTLNVNKTICLLVQYQQRRPGRWIVHFQAHLDCPSASSPSIALATSVSWTAFNGSIFFGRNKQGKTNLRISYNPGFDDPSPAPLRPEMKKRKS